MNSRSTTFPRDSKLRTLFPGLSLTTINGKMPALTYSYLGRLLEVGWKMTAIPKVAFAFCPTKFSYWRVWEPGQDSWHAIARGKTKIRTLPSTLCIPSTVIRGKSCTSPVQARESPQSFVKEHQELLQPSAGTVNYVMAQLLKFIDAYRKAQLLLYQTNSSGPLWEQHTTLRVHRGPVAVSQPVHTLLKLLPSVMYSFCC